MRLFLADNEFSLVSPFRTEMCCLALRQWPLKIGDPDTRKTTTYYSYYEYAHIPYRKNLV
jgi:hypothetical protein